jgi:hypothetical protein
MRITRIVVVVAACSLAPSVIRAQVGVPFFSGANIAFDPEISVVNSGEVLDAQAVVSNDRKYVTLNMRASSSRLLALREFQFATGGNTRPLGFVGGAGGVGGVGPVAVNASGAGDGRQNVLDRQGTNLVARLDD